MNARYVFLDRTEQVLFRKWHFLLIQKETYRLHLIEERYMPFTFLSLYTILYRVNNNLFR